MEEDFTNLLDRAENRLGFAESLADEQEFYQFDKVDLIQALETVPQTLFHFLIPEQLTEDIPDFHIEMFKHMIGFNSPKFALAVPRGHAKTTVVKLAICWYFMFSTKARFIVYCSNTAPIALDECMDIIAMLTCDNMQELFGPVEWITQSKSSGRWVFRFRGRICILKAQGAGQQVRGMNIDHQRPQIFIFDDAEDDELTGTQGLAKKFKNWVFGAAFKSCARDSKKLWIGNLISNHCLINEFCNSEDWDSMKYGCVKSNGTPLWPGMFTIEYLQADFLEYQRAGMAAKWFAEMMNTPVPEGMGLLREEDIKYGIAANPTDIVAGFIVIDPAISKSKKADKTGITVHALLKDTQKWQIIDFKLARLDPIETFEIAYWFAAKYHLRVIGIETAAYQAALESFFRFLLIQRKDMGIEIVSLYASARKVERIVVWASWIKKGDYLLTEGDMTITSQLLNYDPQKDDNDDDIIDSGAYGPQMITQHMNLLMINAVLEMPTAETAQAICGF